MDKITTLTDIQREKLWEFLRGDAHSKELQAWLYNDSAFENALGGALYLELISLDFESKINVETVKRLIRPLLEVDLKCKCACVRNLDAIDIDVDGFADEFFATLTEVAKPKTDQWWLFISRCEVCGTNWLVAQEEVMNDDFYVQRISDEALRDAQNGKWPTVFQKYSDVLEAAAQIITRDRGL